MVKNTKVKTNTKTVNPQSPSGSYPALVKKAKQASLNPFTAQALTVQRGGAGFLKQQIKFVALNNPPKANTVMGFIYHTAQNLSKNGKNTFTVQQLLAVLLKGTHGKHTPHACKNTGLCNVYWHAGYIKGAIRQGLISLA